jgi:hypothetical protein
MGAAGRGRFCDVRCSTDVAVLIGVDDCAEDQLEGVASRVLRIQLVWDEFGCPPQNSGSIWLQGPHMPVIVCTSGPP